ncbi:hypothetical protein A5717_01700 [Mycolicibacterium porcinum]|uniref:hypothetical protein n=1 Tax=Mycolicibacterium porcinum TaxID=39693 RepID=UPI00080B7190|nr:hypothetical protein [Mycolicibacterium porcinum]OCB14774.1 hypothetical protein A5717_01700 [Mycolicibacterium porcinum]
MIVVHDLSVDWLGDLWHYPFHAEVWGDAATWTGAVATGLAALIAAITYAVSRRQDKWAQASLIDFGLGVGQYEVHNRSDQPIIGVRIRLKPRSLWSAARSGNYSGAVVFGGPTLAAFPSHEFYLAAKASHGRTRSKEANQSKLIADKLEAGRSASANLEWVTAAGSKSFIEFRDVHGNNWEYDIEEERLRSVKRPPTALKEKNDRFWALRWIIKNEVTYVWRRIRR